MTSAQKNRRVYDRRAATYDKDRPPHSYLEEPYLLALANIGPNDIVLDAACGTGRYAKMFQNRGAKVVGCDLSIRMIEIAQTKNPTIPFCVVDLSEPLPFANVSYTKVVCSLSIRHIEDLRNLMHEVARILKPGGQFIFSTIHPEMNWDGYEPSILPPIDIDKEGVTFNYSQQTLEERAEEAKLIMTDRCEVVASSAIEPFLTRESFKTMIGRKFVLLYRGRKPSNSS